MRICYRLILLCLVLQIPCFQTALAQRASVSVKLAKDFQQRALYEKNASHYAEAELIYKQALADNRLINTHKIPLVLNYVDLCFLRGDIATALSLLDEHNPTTLQQKHRWIIRRAIAYSFVPDYGKADSLFAIAANIADLEEDARYELLSYQGSMWMDRHDYHRALSLLNAAKALPSVTIEQQWLLNLEKVLPLAYDSSVDEAICLVDSCIEWIQDNLGQKHHSYMVALRKKAELLMMQGNLAEASVAYKRVFEQEKDFVRCNFATMSEQQRLDFWKSHKPHLTEMFALEDQSAGFLADVALFRREVALLGNADSALMLKRLDVSGNKLRSKLNRGELAIDFVCYTQTDTQGIDIAKYGAIVIPSIQSKEAVRFVSLGTASDLENYRLKGNRTLINAIRSNSLTDKNLVYNDKLLYNQIWKPIEPYLKDAREIYFVPDGIINLLGIENLPGSENLCALHRMSSLARLREKTVSAKAVYANYVIGGLDYDTAEQTTDSKPNHEAYHYLQQYFNPNNRIFENLKNARAEVTAIDSLLTHCELSDTETEETFKDKIKRNPFNIIHLSTHGYAMQIKLEQVPHALSDSLTEDKSLLASGIALAGANVAAQQNNKEDGLLSAREFCEMDLSQVDLVVLSACQTALGEVSDEGPAGLIRGLKKAGAHNIIASLWSVNDYSTALFMRYFYEEYCKNGKQDKHQAMKEAQRRLQTFERKRFERRFDPVKKISTTSTEVFTLEHSFEQPYYWAPFILIENI